MLKTFVISPVAGVVAAVLGWTAAILFRDSMSAAAFADLRFGWEGAIVGATAFVAIAILLVAKDLIEPLVLVVSAAAVAAYMWDRTTLPFTTSELQAAGDSTFWFSVATGGVILVVLMLGLRSARQSTSGIR